MARRSKQKEWYEVLLIVCLTVNSALLKTKRSLYSLIHHLALPSLPQPLPKQRLPLSLVLGGTSLQTPRDP